MEVMEIYSQRSRMQNSLKRRCREKEKETTTSKPGRNERVRTVILL